MGQVIGYIADGPAAAARQPPMGPASAPPTKTQPPRSVEPDALESHAPRPRSAESPRTVRASPYARKLAQERHVDLSALASGRKEVHADAVLNPDAALHAAASPQRVSWPSILRKSVAHKAIESLATPTFQVTAQLPVEPLRKAAEDMKLPRAILLARAGALSVKANPLFNAIYTPDGLAERQQVNVGILIDTVGGTIAAVLRDVAVRSTDQLADDWRKMYDRASNRRPKAPDYQGATFYISDLGSFPVVHSCDAVLPLGAAAILCVGSARGELASFTLRCDQRVVAGADAARFLQSLALLLADPIKLGSGRA